MCVIVHKPVGVALPSDDVLSKCWSANSDGAGIMILRGDNLACHKGFMTKDSFLHHLHALKITAEDDVGLHFRIKTSGLTDPQRTHPFPVSEDLREMKALSFQPDAALMHNGIFGAGQGKNSDTMLFVQKYLAKDFWYPALWQDATLREILEKLTGTTNKLLLMHVGQPGLRVGHFTEKSGVFFSNLSWSYSYTSFGQGSRSYGHWSRDDRSEYRKVQTVSSCPTCGSARIGRPGGYSASFEVVCSRCGAVVNTTTGDVTRYTT